MLSSGGITGPVNLSRLLSGPALYRVPVVLLPVTDIPQPPTKQSHPENGSATCQEPCEGEMGTNTAGNNTYEATSLKDDNTVGNAVGNNITEPDSSAKDFVPAEAKEDNLALNTLDNAITKVYNGTTDDDVPAENQKADTAMDQDGGRDCAMSDTVLTTEDQTTHDTERVHTAMEQDGGEDTAIPDTALTTEDQMAHTTESCMGTVVGIVGHEETKGISSERKTADTVPDDTLVTMEALVTNSTNIDSQNTDSGFEGSVGLMGEGPIDSDPSTHHPNTHCPNTHRPTTGSTVLVGEASMDSDPSAKHAQGAACADGTVEENSEDMREFQGDLNQNSTIDQKFAGFTGMDKTVENVSSTEVEINKENGTESTVKSGSENNDKIEGKIEENVDEMESEETVKDEETGDEKSKTADGSDEDGGTRVGDDKVQDDVIRDGDKDGDMDSGDLRGGDTGGGDNSHNNAHGGAKGDEGSGDNNIGDKVSDKKDGGDKENIGAGGDAIVGHKGDSDTGDGGDNKSAEGGKISDKKEGDCDGDDDVSDDDTVSYHSDDLIINEQTGDFQLRDDKDDEPDLGSDVPIQGKIYMLFYFFLADLKEISLWDWY